MLIRGFLTIAIAHFTAASIIAICALGFSSALFGAFLFMLCGGFYLIAEAPFIFFSFWILSRAKTLLFRVLAFTLIVVCAALVGALLTIKIDGSRPDDYLLGYTLAGIAVGLITCIAGRKYTTETKK